MEKHFVTVEETNLKSRTVRTINKAQKDRKARAARVSTEEGRKAAMEFIFGSKK